MKEVAPILESYPRARTLALHNMTCEVVVRADADVVGINVRLEMTEARARDITRGFVGDDLMLRDTPVAKTTTLRGNNQTVITHGAGRVISIGQSSLIISGGSRIGSIVIDGKPVRFDAAEEDEPPSRIVVSVQPGIAISVHDPSGPTTIGAVGGPLTVTGSSVGDVRCELARSLKARLSGTGDVLVTEIGGGDVDALTTGTGEIEIEDGRATTLTLCTNGTGDARFGGVAEEANLITTGTGDIRVKHVLGKVRELATGSGNIHIRKRGR